MKEMILGKEEKKATNISTQTFHRADMISPNNSMTDMLQKSDYFAICIIQEIYVLL